MIPLPELPLYINYRAFEKYKLFPSLSHPHKSLNSQNLIIRVFILTEIYWVVFVWNYEAVLGYSWRLFTFWGVLLVVFSYFLDEAWHAYDAGFIRSLTLTFHLAILNATILLLSLFITFFALFRTLSDPDLLGFEWYIISHIYICHVIVNHFLPKCTENGRIIIQVWVNSIRWPHLLVNFQKEW